MCFRYEIMLACWRVNPKLRPLFDELERSLSKLLDTNIADYYVRLNELYLRANVEKYKDGRIDYLSSMGTPDSQAPSPPPVQSDTSAPSTSTHGCNTVIEIHLQPEESSTIADENSTYV